MVIVSGRQDLPSDASAFSLTSFKAKSFLLRLKRVPVFSKVPSGSVLDLFLIIYKEQSTANSNSFKIAQKTAFEVKGRLYTTGKVIQRLFIIDLYT